MVVVISREYELFQAVGAEEEEDEANRASKEAS